MSGLLDEPYFRAGLFPSLLRRGKSQTPRFLVKTSWEVGSPQSTIPEFQRFDSLLVLDDLFVSVIPFTYHHDYPILTTPIVDPDNWTTR